MADLMTLAFLHELNLSADPDPEIRANAAYQLTASDFLPRLSDDDQRLIGDALARSLLTDPSGQVRTAVAQSLTAPEFINDPAKLDLVTRIVLSLRQALAAETDPTAQASEQHSIQTIQAMFAAQGSSPGTTAATSSIASDDSTFPWGWLLLAGGLTVMATGGVLLYREFRRKPGAVVG